MKILRNLSTFILLAALSACTVWPTGEDPYSLNARRDANRVVEAIQTYRQQTGTFPPSLGALVPTYLPSLPDGPTLQYNAGDGSLAYHYIPSWPQLQWTWCSSVGNTTNWRCTKKMT
ncbi:MAG: hypothetical protein ABSC92_10175 [Rhizomicrobium sp.]|jgi:hypothetical protein